MGHRETLWLKIFHGSTILLYRWYVDNTFCLFHSDRDATIFFDYINSRHPNIRSTKENQVQSINQTSQDLLSCSSCFEQILEDRESFLLQLKCMTPWPTGGSCKQMYIGAYQYMQM